MKGGFSQLMFGTGRTLGIAIIFGGVLMACSGTMLSIVSVSFSIVRIMGGIVMSGITFLLISIPVISFGAVVFWRGKRELAELAQIRKQKIILNMIKIYGQVKINDVALALKTNQQDVKELIYDLAIKNLFHGYINWDNQILYPTLSSALQGATSCPYCGGKQEFIGKNIEQCLHCNTQIFL